ncbi:MAG: hypothetical protein JW966_08985 [Anaerolineae bacterium]|nr:hypothetical protein [Anaerolineae bacterium]
MHVTNRSSSDHGISWFVLLIGVALGLGLGLLYSWEIDPVVELNTEPWQLGAQAREDYVIAIALSYAHNQDVTRAFNRLLEISPDRDVWDTVAEVACERHKRVQVTTNSDVLVMRSLEQLYRPQGASGCADGQYPTPAPVNIVPVTPTITQTPTLPPPLTKTATPPIPTTAPTVIVNPTNTPPPSGSYVLGRIDPFCNADKSGVIEVEVYNRNAEGVPGMPITVTWSGDQQDTFFTGLKPDQGVGYADFEMVPDRSYTVTIPGLISTPPPLDASVCDEAEGDGGEAVLTSYRVSFQQQIN